MSNPASTDYTQNLKLSRPSSGSADYDKDFNQNWLALDFITQGRTKNFTTSGVEVSAGSGLSVSWTSGAVHINGTDYLISASSGNTTDNTAYTNLSLANFVYVNSTGSVTIGTVLPTADYAALAIVFTSAGAIVKVVDARNWYQLRLDGSLSMKGNLTLAGNALYGAATSGANLTLGSTSHATKGKIVFGTSVYDEANDRLGIGLNAPSYRLQVKNGHIVNTTPDGATHTALYSTGNIGVLEVFDAGNTAKKNLSLCGYGGNVIIGGTGTPASALEVVGGLTMTSGGITLSALDVTDEGGQINWKGAASYPEWVQDVYQAHMRFYLNTASDGLFEVTNSGSGKLDMAVKSSIGIGTAPQYPVHHSSGAHLSVGGTWNNASSRLIKENLAMPYAEFIFNKIQYLPIYEYNYKADPTTKNFGPMAEDFYSAFGWGLPTSLSPVDLASAALVAHQELVRMLKEKGLI